MSLGATEAAVTPAILRLSEGILRSQQALELHVPPEPDPPYAEHTRPVEQEVGGRLAELGYPGSLGLAEQTRRFQDEAGLPVDGVPGPETLALLDALTNFDEALPAELVGPTGARSPALDRGLLHRLHRLALVDARGQLVATPPDPALVEGHLARLAPPGPQAFAAAGARGVHPGAELLFDVHSLAERATLPVAQEAGGPLSFATAYGGPAPDPAHREALRRVQAELMGLDPEDLEGVRPPAPATGTRVRPPLPPVPPAASEEDGADFLPLAFADPDRALFDTPAARDEALHESDEDRLVAPAFQHLVDEGHIRRKQWTRFMKDPEKFAKGKESARGWLGRLWRRVQGAVKRAISKTVEFVRSVGRRAKVALSSFFRVALQRIRAFFRAVGKAARAVVDFVAGRIRVSPGSTVSGRVLPDLDSRLLVGQDSSPAELEELARAFTRRGRVITVAAALIGLVVDVFQLAATAAAVPFSLVPRILELWPRVRALARQLAAL